MNNDLKPLIIIGGATGVGKTELSVKLAERIGGEIISADSMQVYKHFDIGTAKIRPDEMGGIKHYLIDILEPDQEFNIFDFQRLCMEAMEEIYRSGHIPIIVGGTGFYIQSVLYNIEFKDETGNRDIRLKLEQEAGEKGNEYIYELLKAKDPKAAELIHPNNVKRVIRALEYYFENGEKISEHNNKQRQNTSPYNFAYFILDRQRESIYERINMRVDKMLADGLVKEMQDLLESGVSADCQAMQGIGYKEMIPYLNGSITLEEAAWQIRKNSRNYAKRQITWFKREKEAIWLRYEDFEDNSLMLDYMTGILSEKGIINV